ncbi:MAG: hypothetical protein KAT96_01110 [Candidatus Omnitrophica bacterium]|nr:hypothetical protein [Candidatus Omnitrophota bacterium]
MSGALKHFIFFSLFFFLMFLIVPFVYSEVTALGDILDSPQAFNGREVEIEGEVIGESLKDDKGVWINIVSGSKQIGVFSANKRAIEPITYWGSYRYTGDRLRIKGIFYKDCLMHQVSDVHLNTLEVIKKGYRNKFSVSPQKRQLAIMLSIICLMTTGLYLIKLKYGK